MREEMKRLNVVKYATSEEQKKKLLEKGFKPVAASKEKKQDKETGGGPGKGKAVSGDGNA
ncbi:hypothetical protein AALB47_25710 [Lachnospiraceae bacterium 54-11]